MRLAYIVNARLPTEKAHGYQISRMCAEFAAAGHKVELWLPTRDNPIKTDIFSYYNLKPSFSVRYLKSYDWLRWVKPLGRTAFYLQSIWFWFNLRLLKLPAGSLVYTRNPSIAWLFARRGYRTAYECHDWFGRSRPLALFFLRPVDFIITTNHFIKNEFKKRGFNKEILVAPNGIDLNIFKINLSKAEAIEQLEISADLKGKLASRVVLLYTGSFRTMGVGKGIDEALAALAALNDRNLFLAAVGGSAADIAFYELAARQLGLAEQTAFLPRVSQTQLARWQRSADILLMPFPDKAHYRYHMTPLKTFEYMASGRPIIASDLPSIRQILNKKTAFFCQTGNSQSLARAIGYVLAQPGEAKQKAARAQKAVAAYTWQKRAERILAFIN